MNELFHDPFSAPAERIGRIAEKVGLGPDDWEPFGHTKAKLSLGLEQRLRNRARGKYIGVTAINPTPLGEGKTVTTIGLCMGLSRLGQKTIATLRQPSLGPVFGIKGGGAGGGRSYLLPFEDINGHFTGDLHAVTSAHNLLCAMVDNHIQRRRQPLLDADSVGLRRVVDMNDKGLTHIIAGLDHYPQAPLRETGFDLTAASEVMAILALATSFADLRHRLGNILVGRGPDGNPVRGEDIGCAGAMAALLRDAFRPSLVQTCENNPVIVHAGPFANIAHGNCSIVADQASLHLADYTVTESGFGADCGAEKFFNIKCRTSGLNPDLEVLVCTVRALKYQSGQFQVVPGKPLPANLIGENFPALNAGAVNLQAHIDIVRQFGLPVVVSINRFPTDTDREIDTVRKIALDFGADDVAVFEAFSKGGTGAEELAQKVVAVCQRKKPHFQLSYSLETSAEEKIEILATRIYGAEGVDFDAGARKQLHRFRDMGYGQLPVCVAKTQYSLSHDPKLLGRPRGYRFPIREVRLSAGAGFLYALAGEISTMPGLPAEPAALRIDVDAHGKIHGLT